MATASAFSYAQAAKGQGALPSSTLSAQSVQEPQPSAAAPKTAIDVESAIDSTDTVRGVESSANAEKQDIVSNTGSEVEARSEGVRETRRELLRDDDAGRLDLPWRRGDKGTRSSSATTRSVDEQDSRRARKPKKSKASEKQAGDQSAAEKDHEPEREAPKVELFEAPIPSVNVWRQRAEAHLAKAKPPTATPAEQASSGLHAKADVPPKADMPPKADVSPKVAENGVPAAGQRDSIPNVAKTHRKTVDAPRPERNASRGSRSADKDAGGVPPSVADTAAWPTPETAIKEEKKKPSEKTDRPEKDASEDGTQSRPRQKEKWVTMDYVPSVNFETQIPQMRSSKPRGGARNANGSRATGASHAGDKAAAPAANQGKFNENNNNNNKDRPRDGANGPNRNAPPSQASKRVSADMSNAREQRKAANQTVPDKNKDTASNTNEQGHAVRERTENQNRSDRPRGGYRGRGGHHPVNAQHQHQHPASTFSASGAMGGRAAQGPYSPPPRQGGHGQVFIPSQRGGRGGRGSATGFHRMSLPNGSTRIPQVQAPFGPYEYPMTPMTAMPFQPQPYWDNMLVPVLKSQVEYYFSIENLCKDVYLRARMDSQGFVPLHFIASFKRVRELSADIAMVRAVCEISTELDLVVGEDDVERVRRSQAWESFVLPLEDRDEFARNHGPAHLTFKNRPSQLPPQFSGMPVPYGMASPPAFAAHADAHFQQLPDESIVSHGINGFANGQVNGHAFTSQLSADVPDFSPSGALSLGDLAKPNGSVIVNGHVEKPVDSSLPNGVHSEQLA
ncbi:la domain family [Trichoderma cornu-damae]|uniref:La domain family n=1 Tax=Trichoderma cornu-damae TaxID=654480 RepID=A0A9P8QWB6_9HYPO|nr:la domain family [Trichoderma cornu-damae]